jgi:hypothetical protein
MVDRFLLDLHLFLNWIKKVQVLQSGSDGGQSRACRKMVRRRCDRLVHGDAPPHFSESTSDLREDASLFFCLWQAHLAADDPAAHLGET